VSEASNLIDTDVPPYRSCSFLSYVSN